RRVGELLNGRPRLRGVTVSGHSENPDDALDHRHRSPVQLQHVRPRDVLACVFKPLSCFRFETVEHHYGAGLWTDGTSWAPSGGWAADRAAMRRTDGRMLVGFGSMLMTSVLIWLAFAQRSGQVAAFIALMGMGCMIAYAYYASVYATIQDIVPPSLRGTAM